MPKFAQKRRLIAAVAAMSAATVLASCMGKSERVEIDAEAFNFNSLNDAACLAHFRYTALKAQIQMH